MRWWVFVVPALAGAAFVVPPSGGASASPPKGGTTNLAPTIRVALATWNVPGLAVVIIHDGHILHLGGYGVRTAGKKDPVTPDTLFPISSNSKAFTTAAMALLAGEGKLDWDDPVCKHLDWFRLSDPLVASNVTLRDLACHRTGLGSHPLLSYRAPWSPEEAIRRAGRLPLDRPFRTVLQYQNTLFSAAGFAAAKAAGLSWSDLIRKRLLQPLRMKDTRLSLAEVPEGADLALPHRLDRGGDPALLPRFSSKHPDPALSIHTSARDLAVWLRFHLNEGTLDGKEIIPAEQLRLTHMPQIPIRLSAEQELLFPDSLFHSYALGWVASDQHGERMIAHGGAIDGFRTHIVLVPDRKLGLAILANLDQTPAALALSQVLLDQLLGWPKRDWYALHRQAREKRDARLAEQHRERLARRRFDTTPSLALGAYAGTYEHPAYGKADIVLQRGRLLWRWGEEEGPLEHFHHDTFVLNNDLAGDPDLTFHLDEAGRVSEVEITGNLGVTFKRLSPRSKP